MNWNPFKRIAALERELSGLTLSHTAAVNRLNSMSLDYVSKYTSLSLVLKEHDERLASLQKQIGAPVLTISRADVEKEAKARLKRAAYSRKYYANKRAEKAKAAAAGDAK